jgi:hypothetical protein
MSSSEAGALEGLARSYFKERAEAEIDAARAAAHPRAARAHYLLAGYYLDFAYNAFAASDEPGANALAACAAPC